MKKNQNDPKAKSITKKILLVFLVAVVAFVGTCIWFIAGKVGQIIINRITPDITVDTGSLSTATPRPDAIIKYTDGSPFDGYVFTEELYSSDAVENPTKEYNYIKSIAKNQKFCIVYISTDKNEDTTQIFDKEIELYIAQPDGMNTKEYFVYMINCDEFGEIYLEKQIIGNDNVFLKIKTTKIMPLLISEKDFDSLNPPVTPTPGITDTPDVTETPTQNPTETPTDVVTPTITPTPEETPNINLNEIMNIVLYGVDSTAPNSFSGNSDTIMILSMNTKTKQVILTSVMRDLWVELYDAKNNATGKYYKINAAFAWYGSDGSINTIEHYFNIKIDNFVVVNFNGIQDIMNVLGGVDINLTQKEAEIVIGNGSPAGMYSLTGSQALTYMRIRKIDNDRNRTLRQGKVLNALMNKFSSASFNELMGLFDQCTKYIRTNMDLFTMQSIARILYDSRANGLNHNSYPVKFKDKIMPGIWAVEENNKEYNLDWFHKRICGYTG